MMPNNSTPPLQPEWFSLENYDPCATMGLHAWAFSLLWREDLNSALEDTGVVTSLPFGWDDFESPLKRLSTNVGSTVMYFPGIEGFGDQDLSSYANSSAFCAPTVSTVSLDLLGSAWRQALDLEEVMPYKSVLQSKQYIDLRDDPLKYNKLKTLQKTPIETLFRNHDIDFMRCKGEVGDGLASTDVMAAIALSAPEEQLISDFTDFVREQKKLLSLDTSSSPFGSKDFLKWHDNRVLPYLDLMLWHKHKNIQATHQEMGVLLFPDEFNISLDSRIRRTVRPMAMRLISRTFVDAIECQARAVPQPA